jgi:hypothetical protein
MLGRNQTNSAGVGFSTAGGTPKIIRGEVKMDRREMLQEGVKSLGQTLSLALGALAGLGGVLQLANHAVQAEPHNFLPVKRKKKPIRRDPECT